MFDPRSYKNTFPDVSWSRTSGPRLCSHTPAVGFEVAESPLESRRNFTGDPSANSEVHLWSLWMQRKVVTMEPRNRAKRWPSMLGCPDGTGCTYGPKENLGQSNESVCHRVVHQGSSHHILTWKQIFCSTMATREISMQYAGHTIPKNPGSSYNQQTFSKCSRFQQPTSASLFA